MNNLRKALFTGTFDPFTNGHLDIVERSLQFCDELIIAVSHNDQKSTLFSLQERVSLVQTATQHLKNVKVIIHTGGLSVDLADELGCQFLVKGARNQLDFAYEQSKIHYGLLAKPNIETIIFPTRPDIAHISSSGVKEFFRTNGDVRHMVSEVVFEALQQKMKQELVAWSDVKH